MIITIDLPSLFSNFGGYVAMLAVAGIMVYFTKWLIIG